MELSQSIQVMFLSSKIQVRDPPPPQFDHDPWGHYIALHGAFLYEH